MTKAVVVTLTAMFIASLAQASEGVKIAMRPATSFGYLDTDKDSRITPVEAKADWAVAESFQRADANQDGVLDKSEFATLTKG